MVSVGLPAPCQGDGGLTKLGGSLAINGGAGPVVWPGDISVFSQGNHRFNGERHTGLAFADGLILGIMRHVRRAVEQFVDAVTTISTNDAAVLLLGVLLDDVAKLPYQHAWFDSLDSLLEALACRLNNSHIIRICLRFVADVICLVEISMVALMVDRNINVKDITVKQHPLVRNTVADDLVHRRAAGLGEVVVVERRRVRL